MKWKNPTRPTRLRQKIFTALLGLMIQPCAGFAAEAVNTEAYDWSTWMTVGEDRFSQSYKLNLSLARDMIGVDSTGKIIPVSFYVYTNYPDAIKTYTIKIYKAADTSEREPVYQITTQKVNPYEPINWDGTLTDGSKVKIGERYKAVLEVTDHAGVHEDTTKPVFLNVQTMTEQDRKNFLPDPYDIPGFGMDRTDKRTITGFYNTVIIQGGGLQGAAYLNGERVVIDRKGNFIKELLLPPGTYVFSLQGTRVTGETFSTEQKVHLNAPGQAGSKDIFYVALADITIGRQSVSGHKELLNNDYHYNGDKFTDGRFAFYVKGRTRDKYRYTAQLDTQEGKLSEIFGDLDKKDPRRLFRDLDGKEYYPVFGDDSTLVRDVDTAGRFYLRVEKDKRHFLWGNYQTGLTGTEYANYNRTLYGAQLGVESNNRTKFDDTRSYFTAFSSYGNATYDHNEFIATGGSLYYLKHQRVTEGSEKLQVEIRDKDTGRVLNRYFLTPGNDYTFNAFEGRILLTRPLQMHAAGDTIIDTGTQQGHDVILIADYEYYDDHLTMTSLGAVGMRGYRWLGEHFRLGGAWFQEDPEQGGKYQLHEYDLMWKPAKGTWSYLEKSRSRQHIKPGFYSPDGGLSFANLPLVSGDRGHAWKFEQMIDFRDFTKGETPLLFHFYRSHVDAGFSALGVHSSAVIGAKADGQIALVSGNLDQVGGKLTYQPEKGSTSWLLQHDKSSDVYGISKKTTVQAAHDFNSGLTGTFELAKQVEQRGDRGTIDDLLGAVKLTRNLSVDKKETLYLIQQFQFQEDSVAAVNGRRPLDHNANKTTLGYTNDLNMRLAGRVEVFHGDLGNGGSIGLESRQNRNRYYSRFTTDVDSTSARSRTWVTGGEYYTDSATSIYTERQFKNSSLERSTSDVYGVRYRPDKNRTLEMDYSKGYVNYSNPAYYNLGDISQQVANVRYLYSGVDTSYRSSAEWRRQEGKDVVRQYVISNYGKRIYKNGWTILGQFDYSLTNGMGAARTNARYTEAALGFAYRPPQDDSWNLFGKVTFLRGLAPENQLILDGGSDVYDDFEQRSWVYALEGNRRFNKRWDLAFKAAIRQGEMRQVYRDRNADNNAEGDRNGNAGAWVSSNAEFFALRGNYFVNQKWDAFVERRWLFVDDAFTAKTGWLVGVYRKAGEHAKIGVGYNFTDYNDDLTHLNFRSRGYFLNVIGEW